MKKHLLVIVLAVVLVSCQKNSDELSQDTISIQPTPTIPVGYTLPACVTPVETAIMAAQTTNTGSITVWNDETNVYVYYMMSGNFLLKETHLYVGSCSAIPVNGAGNPRIGLYPYSANHGTTGVAGYTYTIPRSSLPAGCLCVSAHAVVGGTNASGQNFNETGWGQGTQVNDGGSWAMKFSYCQQDCEEGPR